MPAIDRCELVGSTMLTTFTMDGATRSVRSTDFARWHSPGGTAPESAHSRSAQIHHLGGVPSGVSRTKFAVLASVPWRHPGVEGNCRGSSDGSASA